MKVPSVDRANRIVLAIIGLLYVAVGVAVLLHSTGALGTQRANSPVISSLTSNWYGAQGSWFWIAVGAAALLVVVLCIWWISAQLRTHGGSRLELATAPEGALTVSSSSLEECIENDAAAYDEIHRARARILIEPTVIRLDITIAVAPPYDVARAVSRINGTVLPHLADTLNDQHPRPVRATINVEATEAAMTRLR